MNIRTMGRRSILKFLGVSGVSLAAGKPVHGISVPQPAQPHVAFNQAGYLPRAAKVATLPGDMHEAEFQLLADGREQAAFRGRAGGVTTDEASGDRVALVDFSSFRVPGLYRLAVGGKRSERFMISKEVYAEPLRLAMRSFYGQRCGCAVDLGDGYRHAACHAQGAYHGSAGRAGALRNTGGWHDAGDYGRYVVNSGISTGTLLWAWELFPKAVQRLHLGIPESGGKTPDFLAEVRWNLEWMLSMQDEDGGVWHKQTSEQFCAFVMPQEDALTSYVIGTGETPFKSTCATADLAAVAAIAARCYGAYDAAFAARCLQSSKRAFAWALAHPAVTFKNPKGVATGEYGDRKCEDELLWAAAELWRTTGDAQYEKSLVAAAGAMSIKAPSWAEVAPLAWWSYALAERKASAALKQQVMEATERAAQELGKRAALSGYGNTMAISDYGWGSNSQAANQSMLLLIAHHFSPHAGHLEVALNNLHYLLGRNCFGVSWVTHVGSNPLQHPHHRPSGADNIAAPWPGLLSGGPNAHPADEVATTLPKLPPMRMWVDDQKAYSLNEVAINWNAPLVFLLAAAHASAM